MKLADRKALIAGGNSGIGLATARLFIAEGAPVAITGRDQKTIDEAIAELGSNARGYRADITVPEDRERLSQLWQKISGNSISFSRMLASPAGPLPVRPTRRFLRASFAPT